MEPQLRRTGGSGTGTPFNPFDPFAVANKPGDPTAADGGASDTLDPAGETGAAGRRRAADFDKGSRRGRRRTDSAAE